MEYIAHKDGDRKQKLIDHLKGTAELAGKFADSFGKYEWGYCCGMLHDIGRFEQIRRFGTFNDVQSVDHAEFGADLLFKEGLIRKFAEGYYEECELAQSDNQSDYCQEERKTKEFLVNNDATAVDDEQIIKNNEYHNKDTGLLEMAIRQHNKYRVKEDLTERQRMFCDILRDADKVDIFKVNA